MTGGNTDATPVPSSGPADEPPPGRRRRAAARLFDAPFWRDGAVTMIATFLGAGMAFWLSGIEADREKRETVTATLGYMREDCDASLTDLQQVDVSEEPVPLAQTTTLLTLATSPTFADAIAPDARGALLRSIYRFNRSGSDYSISAARFDGFMKLHAAEFEHLQRGQMITRPYPGPQPVPPPEFAARHQEWLEGEEARRADLADERVRLLAGVQSALKQVAADHERLCAALRAASHR